MKIITYNVRSRSRIILATVTVVESHGQYARGIAIRCATDVFNKTKAFNISQGRAFKAFNEKKNNSIIRPENSHNQPVNLIAFLGCVTEYDILEIISCPRGSLGFYKGIFDPQLTVHEINMLNAAKY